MTEKQAHGNNLFVVIERYTPNEGATEEVLSITDAVGKMMHGFPGLLQLQILKPTKGGDVISTAAWDSEDAFKGFMKSEAVKELMKSDTAAQIKELISGSSFDTYELTTGWHPEF